MNVGGQTGGVQKSTFQIDGLAQVQLLRGLGSQEQQLVHGMSHLGLGPPFVITFEGAFAGHPHTIDLADAAKILEQGTVGKAGGKAPKVLPEEVTGEIGAQRPSAMKLVVLLGFGADFLASWEPIFEIRFQQLGFQATLGEQGVDLQEVLAQLTVIDIALNGGQGLREGQLKGNNGGGGHAARLQSSLDRASFI
jgi:hypothetical protein